MADSETFTGKGFYANPDELEIQKRWDGFTVTSAELKAKAKRSPYAALCIQLISEREDETERVVRVQGDNEKLEARSDEQIQSLSAYNNALRNLRGAVSCAINDLRLMAGPRDRRKSNDDFPRERRLVTLGRILGGLQSAHQCFTEPWSDTLSPRHSMGAMHDEEPYGQ